MLIELLVGRSRELVDQDRACQVDGRIDFKKFAPYVGLGWGNAVAPAKPGWGFTADLGVMMLQWACRGVEQDGQATRLLWQEREPGRVQLTTELHRDQEAELIRLATAAAADRTHALTPGEVAAAIARTGMSYTGEHGEAQRKAAAS